MNNRDVGQAWHYHRSTNHSLASVQANARMLDFPNMPIPYKIYTTLEPIPLLRDFPPSSVSALNAVASTIEIGKEERVPDLAALARLCLFSNGITKRIRRGDRTIDFRAAACTGALFHIELYPVCADLPDLPAGLYHYGAHDQSLRQLRSGDFRDIVATATAAGRDFAAARAPVIVICTSTFWRNAWKYETRAYRHSYWDGGTVQANFLAEATALDLPAEVVLGFADEPINQLIDVEPDKETAISLVAVGHTDTPSSAAPPISPLNLPTEQLSRSEVEYPEIPAMHRSSFLLSGEEVASWREQQPAFRPFPPSDQATPLQPISQADLPTDPLETVIRRRGSTRQFTREPITFAQLSTILERSTHGIPADCIPPGAMLNDLYLIVNAVDGLQSGTYVYWREDQALELLRAGEFREDAGYLALGQELGADAAINCYFLIDLEPVLAAFGNRGYRVAQLEAAITAGRIYLASYALRLGATGLTFFDDDVTAFFSPHAAGKSVMFLVAIGHPMKRKI